MDESKLHVNISEGVPRRASSQDIQCRQPHGGNVMASEVMNFAYGRRHLVIIEGTLVEFILSKLCVTSLSFEIYATALCK